MLTIRNIGVGFGIADREKRITSNPSTTLRTGEILLCSISNAQLRTLKYWYPLRGTVLRVPRLPHSTLLRAEGYFGMTKRHRGGRIGKKVRASDPVAVVRRLKGKQQPRVSPGVKFFWMPDGGGF